MNNELLQEIEHCKRSPYYYATKYLTVNGRPFTKMLTEEEFNKEFFRLGTSWVDNSIAEFTIKNNYEGAKTNPLQ